MSISEYCDHNYIGGNISYSRFYILLFPCGSWLIVTGYIIRVISNSNLISINTSVLINIYYKDDPIR